MDSACLSGRMFDSRSRRPGFGAMVFLVGVLLGRSHQSPSIVLLKSRKCINNVILRPDRSEIMLEAEYRAVYSINQSASKNLGQSISNQSHYSSCPQLGGGIEIAQLSYYSRGKTPPLCLPVCRRLQLVSFDDGILVVEWIQSTAL